MTEAISNNALLSMAFGIGRAAGLREPFGSRRNPETPDGRPVEPAGQPQDTVEISPVARRIAEEHQALGQHERPAPATERTGQHGVATGEETGKAKTDPAATSPTGKNLSEEDQQQVSKLENRDREVRQHEQAHVAAGGGHVRGGASFEYETGPDGKQYATGGEVQIDTAAVPDDPQATIQKMQQIRRAALAPAEPSSQDRAVAAQAQAVERQARQELSQQKREGNPSAAGPPGSDAASNGSPPGGIESPATAVEVAHSVERSPQATAQLADRSSLAAERVDAQRSAGQFRRTAEAFEPSRRGRILDLVA